MIKKERDKLWKQMNELLASVGASAGIAVHCSVWVVHSEYGTIGVTFFNATTHKEFPWMACRFEEYPSNHSPKLWRGWDHWKQNLHVHERGLDADGFVEYAKHHLSKLGVSVT